MPSDLNKRGRQGPYFDRALPRLTSIRIGRMFRLTYLLEARLGRRGPSPATSCGSQDKE